jgi:HAMP domain-containing protein
MKLTKPAMVTGIVFGLIAMIAFWTVANLNDLTRARQQVQHH